MSEAGEIPAEGAPAREGQEEGEVVAAAVVDDDDNEDEGSAESGSVVMAKVVDDEELPTPNTAKIESGIAKKMLAIAPPVAPAPPEKKANVDGDKEEGEVTPVKKGSDATAGGVNNKPEGCAEKPEGGKAPSPEIKEETTTKDAKAEPTTAKVGGLGEEGVKKDSPVEKTNDSEVNKEESKKNEKHPEVQPQKKVDNDTPMGVDSTPKDAVKKEDMNKSKTEEGETEGGEVEDGEVEEGEMAESKPEETKPKFPTAEKIHTEKDTGKNREEVPNKEENQQPEKPSAMDVDESPQKLKESSKEKTKAGSPKDKAKMDTTTDVPTEDMKKKVSQDRQERGMKDESDEDGEIKEDTDEEGEMKEDTEEEGSVKDKPAKEEAPQKDAEMEDVLSQTEEESGDHDAEMAADTASNDGDTADESTTKKVEPTYSTRGRASGSTTPVPRGEATAKSSHVSGAGKSEQWERSVREALEDLGRGAKDAPPAGVGPGGASFLEALGEEERRTRTRFLPAVDGIHMLRKHEIKGDLALARSLMSSSGNVASVSSIAAGAAAPSSAPPPKKSKKKKHHDSSEGEGDGVDSDDGGLSSSEDDPSADAAARVGGASTIEVDLGGLLKVPSAAFVPPPAASYSSAPPASLNGDRKDDVAPPAPPSSTGVKGILNNQRNIKSPRVVESVTAFNPPRPPESVGKKKQHRMLRWERRPADVEVDLNNYRKTVDRTRTELHAAEDELERIEATSNHLRRHFLAHLQGMDQETEEILKEFNSVQQKCVTAADLLTSRTRSRGAGKGSYVMKDVLAVLRARGEELKEKEIDISDSKASAVDSAAKYVGTGGVGGSSFTDWHQNTAIKPQRIASAWILPGDKVETPIGEGVVVEVVKSAKEQSLDPSKTAINGNSPLKMDVDGASPSPTSGSSKGPKKKSSKNTTSDEDSSAVLGTRIGVRFPYGVGYFSPAVVSSKESPDTLSNAQLAKRWSGLIESALSHAGMLDLNGMALSDSAKEILAKQEAGVDGKNQDDHMDIEDSKREGAKEPETGVSSALDGPVPENKLLPFGSRLLPTGTGRGTGLFDMDTQELQQALKPALTEGQGVLGDPANEGVPSIIKDFEQERQESYTFQAKVLHLRNQLYRQRRIRTLNERTFAATRDRSTRVESLVAEMRTDLKSLKNRLDEELVELGIDHEKAEGILKAYYQSQEHNGEEEDHEASPGQKRHRGSVESEKASGQVKRAKVAVQ